MFSYYYYYYYYYNGIRASERASLIFLLSPVFPLACLHFET